MNPTLSPTSAKVGRKTSTANSATNAARRQRAGSHIPPQDTNDAALTAIQNFLKGRTCYDVFPVSFRLIVLDTRLNVKKALQSLLYNGERR
jgi:5'-AMP-activated protein kinase regulatory gamma subunit